MDSKKERKVVGKTVALALGVICIILAVAVGVVIANYTSIVNGKDDTIAADNTRIQTLQTWLNENITLLQQTQAWLQGNITYYNSQITTDNSQIILLNSQVAGLQGQLANLNSQVASLRNQNTTLQNEYAILQSNYTTLMNEYMQALAKIPPDKGITTDGINYTTDWGVTSVAVRNLDVNATIVTSLRLYWIIEGVLASSASEDVVIPGNSTVTITTLLNIHTYNTVYDTWDVKGETLEGYTATSDPIMIAA